MNIIICGAGRVGYTIAKLLSEQDHSITVTSFFCETKCFAIVVPTLPAPHIITFIFLSLL